MLSLQLPRRDERGFTLIELLVVIIIIGILAAIAIPLFLDQRKLAVDASVKSDVRNTATQVQTWQATNQGVVATDATDYQSKGGKLSNSTGNTVNLSVATDGSYLVCGYAGSAAKQYTASSAAYVYDSTSGKFGLGSCTGGLVGGGSPAPSTSAPNNPLGGGVTATTYTATLENGDPTNSMFSAVGLSNAGVSTEQAHTGTSSYKATYTAAQSLQTAQQGFTNNNLIQFTPSPTLTVGKTYTFSAWVYLAPSNGGNDRTLMNVNNSTSNFAASTPTDSNKWVQVTITNVTVNNASAALRIYPQWNGDGNNNAGTIYVDDLKITQTN